MLWGSTPELLLPQLDVVHQVECGLVDLGRHCRNGIKETINPAHSTYSCTSHLFGCADGLGEPPPTKLEGSESAAEGQ